MFFLKGIVVCNDNYKNSIYENGWEEEKNNLMFWYIYFFDFEMK